MEYHDSKTGGLQRWHDDVGATPPSNQAHGGVMPALFYHVCDWLDRLDTVGFGVVVLEFACLGFIGHLVWTEYKRWWESRA